MTLRENIKFDEGAYLKNGNKSKVRITPNETHCINNFKMF